MSALEPPLSRKKANLPTTGVPEGAYAYCEDGRKDGEGAGAGTGCPVWFYAGTWRTFTTGAEVTT